ncbi:hypothetical protein [Candidatus Protochlamydia amoebophila]|uniref:hypothetical protein n=1 Tax=Candidatus Protochlamydia amoebophila TaxID=362787 RepID=UPI001BC9BB54|nr:hypothetical protein [Candidatus Protochlamydia amoebophila]
MSCPLCETYGPNALTSKTMEEADRGENLEEYESLDEFWKSIGKGNTKTEKHKAV